MQIFFHELNFSKYSVEKFYHLLSLEERQRVESYPFFKEQRRFVISRGVLRIVLSQWLKNSPQQIAINTRAAGKPEVEGVHFNLSHTDEKMILAISPDGPVGVDLEKRDSKAWSEEAEELLFSSQEMKRAFMMSSENRIDYFLSVWTKKEAWLKGIGCGISSDLKQFDTENSDWHFTSLPVENSYIASLATSTKDCYVVLSQYPDDLR